MVTVKETPYIDNPNKEAHWLIDETSVDNSWWEVLYSSVGYFLFALIVRSSFKMGVFKKHLEPIAFQHMQYQPFALPECVLLLCTAARLLKHDVFLILFFALFTDIVEFRMRLLIIFDLQYRGDNYGGMMYIPTTVTTCTIVVNLIYAHIMITYVEAIVSIHRFIARFCGRAISVSFVYIPLGIVVSVKILYLLAILTYGQPSPAFSGHCSRTFSIPIASVINTLAWLCTIFIAPILTIPIIIREFMSRKSDDVSVFILLSSLMMAIYVVNWLVLGFGGLQHLNGILFTLLRITGKFHSYRFVFLCVLAAVLVEDIRCAVFTTVRDAISKMTGRQEILISIDNEQFMDGVEMDEKRAMTGNEDA